MIQPDGNGLYGGVSHGFFIRNFVLGLRGQ